MQRLMKDCLRTFGRVVVPALVVVALIATPAPAQNFFNGFEEDTSGWNISEGPLNASRVASDPNGITSATGGWHATGVVPVTNWGGYESVFPAGGYLTSVDVFLDVGAGFPNDTRLDFSSAINNPDGDHRRDFIFNLGFYDDGTGPGAGSDRFVVSASNNTSPNDAFPKNPDKDPIAISATGWYSFVHQFRDNGTGVLEVEMSIVDDGGTVVHSWVLSDPTDVIGVTVGGNRYGWFAFNEFFDDFSSLLFFDNSFKMEGTGSDSDGDGVPDDQDVCPDSDLSPFVDVGSGPTSIDNAGIGADEFGCTIQDLVNACEALAEDHGEYVSCIAELANHLFDSGVISKDQRKEMKTGAAQSSIGK